MTYRYIQLYINDNIHPHKYTILVAIPDDGIMLGIMVGDKVGLILGTVRGKRPTY